MKTQQITEGAIKLIVPIAKRIYEAPVFYNPDMITNRDTSVLLLRAMDRKFWCMDLLAGTGVRGLRIKKEVKNAQVDLNDKNPVAYKLIKRNAKLNKLKVKITNLNAEFRLANYKQVYNYIDIDPFGTPVPYLDAAVKALKWRGGILGITATDTSALCGTYPKACLRKYGAKPLRNYLMHETGIRILIKKVQEVAAQYEVALTPIFCHSTLHYMRVYFKADSGAKRTDKILEQHGFYDDSTNSISRKRSVGRVHKGGSDALIAGPLWLGDLWDEKLVRQMQKVLSKTSVSPETIRLLQTIAEESKIKVFGFYNVHALAKKHKLKQLPKFDIIMQKLRKKGYKASRTHFSPKGIRTNAPLKTVLKILKT